MEKTGGAVIKTGLGLGAFVLGAGVTMAVLTALIGLLSNLVSPKSKAW